MHDFPLKLLQSRNIRGPTRLIQLSDTTDQEIALDLILGTKLCVFAALGCRNLDFPFLSRVVPGPVFYGAVEADVWVEIVFRSDGLEVGEDFFLAGVLAGPVLCGEV